MNYVTNSLEETQKIAGEIAEKVHDAHAVIALNGDLGTGKTTFTQGFARALGILDKIISPTFVVQRQHQIPGSEQVLYHIDLYRLEEGLNITQLGLNELFEDEKAIVLIEWADKIREFLPPGTLYIEFKRIGENSREISLRKTTS